MTIYSEALLKSNPLPAFYHVLGLETGIRRLVMCTDALLLNEQQGYQALLPSSLSGYYGNRKWKAKKEKGLKG